MAQALAGLMGMLSRPCRLCLMACSGRAGLDATGLLILMHPSPQRLCKRV
jgi:hypothetical protein